MLPLVLLALMASAAPLRGQVQLEAELGFQHIIQLGRWMPLRVRLYNPGGSQSGEVYVRVLRGQSLQPMEYRERVELSHQGRRTVDFVVPLLGTDHPLAVGLRDDAGRSIEGQEIDLTGFSAADALVLTLSRDRDLEFLPALQRARTRVAYIRPDELPIRWYGLDGVKVVVVHAVSLSEMDSQRYEALKDWVVAGGTLLFAAGPSYSTLQEPRAAELLPVTVRGLTRVARLPPLPGRAELASPPGEWRALDAEPRRGEVVLAAGPTPIIAWRRLGQGRVVYLAIDYATPRLTNWAGNPALWQLLLPEEREDEMVGTLAEEQALASERHPLRRLLREPLLRLPSRGQVAAALAAYFLLLLGALRWIDRRRGRSWLAWCLLAVGVIAVGGLAAWGLGDPLLRPEGAVLQLKTQVFNAGESRGRAVTQTALFSARGGRLALKVDNPNTVIRAVGRDGGGGGALPALGEGAVEPLAMTIRREGRGFAWDDLFLPKHGASLFTLESVDPVPVTLAARREGNTTSLTFLNRGDREFFRAAVLHRGKFYELGSLRPGEERVETFFDVPLGAGEGARTVAEAVAERLPDRMAGFSGEIATRMVQRQFRRRTVADVADRLIWLGWVAGAPEALHLAQGEPYTLSLSLLVAEVEL